MSNKWIQDGGHGGSDPGAQANGIVEKVYTLEAALYVDKRLGEHGIYSHCTRTKDVTLDEGPRTAKVRKYDRCISHHYNAGGGEGIELIHSIYSDGKFEAILEDCFKKAGFPFRRTFTRKWGDTDYYYMHRETGSTSTTIVEYDFVDGPNSDKLKDKDYRIKMYECTIKAICKWEGVTYKPKGAERVDTAKIETGGLAPDSLKEVADYLDDKGWYWTAECLSGEKPKVTTGGLNEENQADFEDWLNDRGWWYKVVK